MQAKIPVSAPVTNQYGKTVGTISLPNLTNEMIHDALKQIEKQQGQVGLWAAPHKDVMLKVLEGAGNHKPDATFTNEGFSTPRDLPAEAVREWAKNIDFNNPNQGNLSHLVVAIDKVKDYMITGRLPDRP